MYYFGLHSYFICYPFITHKSMTITIFYKILYCRQSTICENKPLPSPAWSGVNQFINPPPDERITLDFAYT